MSDETNASELLEASLPGAWIAEHSRIGQISL